MGAHSHSAVLVLVSHCTMKVALVTVLFALLGFSAEAKSLEHGIEKASKAIHLIDKLVHLTKVHDVKKVGAREDEDEYEVPELEKALCGEYGIGGAFWEAYAAVDEAAIKDATCVSQDEFIWTIVDRVPYTLCFMTPEERRIGFDCVDKYAGEGAPDAINSLKEYIDMVMVFVRPYLPN